MKEKALFHFLVVFPLVQRFWENEPVVPQNNEFWFWFFFFFIHYFFFRLNIPPFVPARTVLEGLESEEDHEKPVKHEILGVKVKRTTTDGSSDSLLFFLHFQTILFSVSCFPRLQTKRNRRKWKNKRLTFSDCVTQYLWRWWVLVGLPVFASAWFALSWKALFLHGEKSPVFTLSGGKGYDPEKADYSGFEAWLQCYYVDGMKSIRDHNGRTMWFKVCFPQIKKKTSMTMKDILNCISTDHRHSFQLFKLQGDPGPLVPKGMWWFAFTPSS